VSKETELLIDLVARLRPLLIEAKDHVELSLAADDDAAAGERHCRAALRRLQLAPAWIEQTASEWLDD